MRINSSSPTSLALFCRVVDNYGDIGICWRLARQLCQQHGIAVTLWVDDLHSFQRICPEVVPATETQLIAGVTVRHWGTQDGEFAAVDIADIVIEFFGCDIPDFYIAAMAACNPKPVWLNLEGLSAEEWVEGCHTLPSPHPRLSLTKYFFFPGFTEKTGGLLCESTLQQERREFQSNPAAMAGFLNQFGLTSLEIASFKISLFCYPIAPVAMLFATWEKADAPVTCLVPEGVAVDAVERFLGAAATAGTVRSSGALTVRVLPFVAQQDYDKLLWACQLNFVRGEDSFVRAQWAGRPFLWHIYPQDENLHHVKLRAFLQRYAPELPALAALSLYWNGVTLGTPGDVNHAMQSWRGFQGELLAISDRAADWERQMRANGDLAANLLKFAATLQASEGKNSV